jgi:predicted nucleic acid-binding protein
MFTYQLPKQQQPHHRSLSKAIKTQHKHHGRPPSGADALLAATAINNCRYE